MHRLNHPNYSVTPPYHPAEYYPEFPRNIPADPANGVYAAVRNSFLQLGYDKERASTPEWNPLSWLINPGETVFLKPNMIAHKHEHTDEWEHVITHGSVIRAVVDYVYLALKGRGRIIVGDGCQSNSFFEKIIDRMGLPQLQMYYSSQMGFDLEIVDLRDFQWVEEDGVFIEKRELSGDPQGRVAVNLGSASTFCELDGHGRKYYGATYDVDETNVHHTNGRHEYAFSRSPLAADVFINLPKLKTHKKCGLTVNLKSLVGLNANKNWLPHYAFGSPESGGDQFPHASSKSRLENRLVTFAKRVLMTKNPLAQAVARRGKKAAYKIFGTTDSVVRSGNWHGNDTVWRMSLDLNRILMYCSADGVMGNRRKRFLSVVDGVVGMDGDGPVAGRPKESGVVVVGTDPVAVDMACARLMCLDHTKLPILYRALDNNKYPLTEVTFNQIVCKSNDPAWDLPLSRIEYDQLIPFTPHFAWKGHIELEMNWPTVQQP